MTGTAIPLRHAPLAVGHRLWRLWLAWRFRLFQRHRHDALVVEEVLGMPLVVLPHVFNPKLFWTGEFLARVVSGLPLNQGTAVLDLGTGTGVGALAAGRRAGRVLAIDVNSAAQLCARINVLLNGLEDRVEVRLGDLWEPVGTERFDLVLFNPPFYPGLPRSDLDQAFRAANLPSRFAAGLREHLRAGGSALVVLSSAGDAGRFLAELRAVGLRVSVLAEERRVGETLTAYRAEVVEVP